MELPSIGHWKQGDEEDISEIHDCLCPNCGEGNAKTLMLPTMVPGFREIIIATLICPDCNFKNSEVSFGGEIQPQGTRITLAVQSSDDMNRQVLKSDSATVLIPMLDLEIPSTTQQGSLTTLEGVLSRVMENLTELQPQRLQMGDIDNFHRCQAVIDKIKRIIGEGDDDDDDDDDEEEEEGPLFPFEFIVDDPAGNSFIENPHAPKPDPNMTSKNYDRTPTQDMALGLQPSQAAVEEGTISDANPAHKNIANAASNKAVELDKQQESTIGRQEVMKFPTECSNCHKSAETTMCVTDIPHFKEVIIMSLICDACGYKSNEIKGGGAIPEHGCRITLTVRSQADLAREVLKSDTAGIQIPEVELELQEGGLDGVYTTVEGLIDKIRDRLEKANPFGSGDSATKQHLSNDGGAYSKPSATTVRYMEFLQELRDLSAGNVFPFTLIINDPLANSFVGPIPDDAIALSLQAEKDGNNACFEVYVDKGMEIEQFERTFDQNEDLGLNDIQTENYNAEVSDYGTDKFAELPDRIRKVDIRGPDHPHEVGKAPVEGDTTVMGAKSANFSVPSITQRGELKTSAAAAATTKTEDDDTEALRTKIETMENEDDAFVAAATFDASREGMVFKQGTKGLGYYTDKPLTELQ